MSASALEFVLPGMMAVGEIELRMLDYFYCNAEGELCLTKDLKAPVHILPLIPAVKGSAAMILGFGVDPALQIDVFNELKLGESHEGVSQVQGFHNGSKAFLFQDTSRSIKASAIVAERIAQKLRNKHEFTVLATLRQEHLNSGVILSLHHSDQSCQRIKALPGNNGCKTGDNFRQGVKPFSNPLPLKSQFGTVNQPHQLVFVDV
ncbi:NELL2 protein, partial [Polypterus senegalus]